MITIKKYNKAEQSTWKFIKQVIHNHQILIGFVSILILLFSFISLITLLMLSTLGGACSEMHARESVEIGTMPIDQYLTLMTILDIVIVFIDYWYFLIKIALIIPIIILFRSIYVRYLKYKHDNL